MLKNENIAKDATLLVTFEITCWLKLKMRPLDASMHLCIYVFIYCKLSTTTTRKKFRVKNIYQKGELCLYRTISLNLLTQKSKVFNE